MTTALDAHGLSHAAKAIADVPATTTASTAVDRPVARKSVRLSAIDVVRGLFMVIILFGHTSANLDKSAASTKFEEVFHVIFSSGETGFTLVSGVMIGIFAATRPNLGPIFSRYREQGARQLFVVHPLIALSLYLPLHVAGVTFFKFLVMRHYLTDVFALLFVAFVPIVPRLSFRARLVLGIVMMTVQRIWGATDFCTKGNWLLLREMVIGILRVKDRHILIDNYSFTTALGVFLLGTCVGDIIGRMQKAGDLGRAARPLFKGAAILTAVGVVLVGIWALLKVGIIPASEDFRWIFHPSRSGSLLPIYLAFVMLLLGLFLRRNGRGGELSRAEKLLQLLGKTSLFAYCVHYALVQTIPYFLGIQQKMTVAMMLVWACGSFAVLMASSALWNRYVKKA